MDPGQQAAEVRYAQLRLDRLVKLVRASLGLRLAGDLAAAEVAHRWILRYARLLVGGLRERASVAAAEQRLFGELVREVPLRDPELRRRAMALAARGSTDRRAADAGAVPGKAGIVSMSPEELGRYVGWIETALPRPAAVVAILSRGLPDAVLAGEVLALPVRALCFSRRRLGIEEVLSVDLEPPPGGGVLLIDAHRETGETLRQCWRFLEARGIAVLGAALSRDDGGEERNLGEVRRARSPGGWSLFTPDDRGRLRAGE